MALTLDQIRNKTPIYNGISDEVMFNDLHQNNYPDMTREELANQVGYTLPELMPKPATLFSGNSTVSVIDLFNDFAVVAGHLLIKGGVAFVLFKLLTLGLSSRHSIISAHQQGRWLSGWFVGTTILTRSIKQLTEGKYSDFFSLYIIAVLVAWIMGYVIGFLWFKLRKYKKNHDHSIQKIDEKHWEFAENEFNSQRKTGLWAESYSEANGDENLAKAIYLKNRATQLAAEEISIKKPVVFTQSNVQASGFDWLEQVTGLNWLKELFVAVLFFIILAGSSVFIYS